MNTLTRFILAFSTLLLFSWPNQVFAGDGQPVIAVFDGSAGQIKKDTVKTVSDPLYAGNPGAYASASQLRNKITLKINSATPWFLQSAFSATVRIRITSVKGSITSDLDTSLTVNYLTDTTYINESSYAFTGAHSVTVKILDVITNAGWDVWKALLLENELQTAPVFSFNCTDNAIQAISIESLAADTHNDEIAVSWGNVLPADEYDLEWTYIDKSALDSGRYGLSSNPTAALLFDNNSSRVTITGTSYKIPLLYDNNGTLFVRVRPVQNQPNGGRSEAVWSSNYSAGLGKFVFNGHERGLNWQATTSFAEEGKRKSVVQYYDGSLRSRQTVTKDNSTQTTIVGESIYDYQGRPVIQVMPAPTLSNLIKYSGNFNTALGGSAYDKDDFDILQDSSQYCTIGAPAMNADSGASRYYSPQNPDKNIGINRFIPDAKGYPFTEVQYTQDNTGRISAQSGVGETHKINNGHDTKYFYGSPDQEELDALFGTEVGKKSHYFKNMVRDANGQYSISYVDMHGRTIATALAGVPTTKMDPDGITSYTWTKVSGGTAFITTPRNASTTVTGLQEGVYVFRLSVTDQLGAVQFNDVTITVNKTPGSPVVSAGADQQITLPTTSVSLSGSATDAGGTISSYLWTKVSGGSATITTASSAATTVTGLQQGVYVFRLTVTDNTSAIATGELTVTVNPSAASLVTRFNFSKTAASVSGWINVTGDPHLAIRTGTDATTGITVSSVATANWSPLSGATASNGQGLAGGTYFPAAVMLNHWFNYTSATSAYNIATPQLELSGLKAGQLYSIKMTASNKNAFNSNTQYRVGGDSIHDPVVLNTQNNTANGVQFKNVKADGSGKIKVYVNTFTGTALANISGIEITEKSPYFNVFTEDIRTVILPDNTITLSGTANDPMGSIAGYTWTKITGPAATITTPSSSSTTVTQLEQGTYIFRLTAENNTGFTATSDITVNVYPPILSQTAVSFNFSKTTATTGGWINMTGDPHLAVRTATDPFSGISVSSVATANWSPLSGATASNGQGLSGGTFFPSKVMENHWFQYKSASSVFNVAMPQLEVSGLRPGEIYTLKMTASNKNAFNSNTTYNVQGNALQTPVVLDTKNNTANGVVFSNVQPDNSGRIRIYVNTSVALATDLANISGLQVIINNMPPGASAGDNQLITLPANFVTLSGSGMDPEAGNVTMETRRLLDSSSNTVTGNSIKSVKSLLVPVAGTHTFAYSLNAASLQLEGCDAKQLCYDCLYDLRITISDDCNNQKLGGKAFDTLFKNFSIGPLDTSCATATPGFNVIFSKYLAEGNYEITKTLAVSKYAQDYYRDSIFINNNTCRTLESFIEEQRQILRANTDCAPSCQKCMDSLGTFETFRDRYIAKARITPETDTLEYMPMIRTAFAQEAADCDILCNKNTESNDIRSAMLSDLTPPSGQYAVMPESDTSVVRDRYSIFYTDLDDEAGTDTVAIYRQVTYLDENGRPDSVYDERTGTMVTPDMLSVEAFAAKFKPSWAQALLFYHPEKCKLDQIESAQMKLSYLWDIDFGAVETYQEALNKGYLNPTNGSGLPFSKYGSVPAGKDPVTDITGYKTLLENHLKEYRDNNLNNSSAGVSLWGLSTGLTMCGTPGAPTSCFTNWSKNDSAFNTSRMCTGDLDMAWRNFRQLYLDIKKEIIAQQVSASCSTAVSSATLMTAGHQPNFGNASEYIANKGLSYIDVNNPTGATATTTQALNTFYEDNCKAYAVQWWLRLKPCGYSYQDSVNIITAFINVCREGSDANHVMGASTVKPSSTYQFRSFEEVMKYYKSSTYNANCNTYLIDFPKPYDQQKAYAGIPIWRKPDSCQCSVINDWYARYQASGQTAGGFAGYLERVADTYMTNGALDSLRGLCNGQITCEYIPSPITLAPALQCGMKDICVTCNVVKNAYAGFKAEFPGMLVSLNKIDSAQFAVNSLFERYMNFKMGFTKSTYEYVQFMNRCNIAISSYLDTLKSIRYDFLNSERSRTPIARFQGNYGRYPDHEEIIATPEIIHDGVLTAPARYADTTELYGFTHIGVTWPRCGWNMGNKSQYTIEARMKIPYTELGQPLIIGAGGFGMTFRSFFYGTTYEFGDIGITLGDTTIDAGFTFDAGTNGLNDWTLFKVVYDHGNYKVYFDNVLKVDLYHPSDHVPISNAIGSGWIGSVIGQIDWYRIYNAPGELVHSEDFNSVTVNKFAPELITECQPADCQSAFTLYFNNRSSTNYTSAQIDSIYVANTGSHPGVCSNDVIIDSAGLKTILQQYQDTYVNPSSGFVDLDMRTTVGNKTPEEGPKGVFNVNGILIGTTIDSTTALVNASFAQIWNSDSANKVVGTLSALSNGKFRLALKPGQSAPCNGIVGMRYYQFETPADSIDAIRCGIGCYMNFGDGLKKRIIKGTDVNTEIRGGAAPTSYGAATQSSQEVFPVRAYSVIHKFITSGIKTVTVYHPDVLGYVGFDNVRNVSDAMNLTVLKNLRGYIPQETRSFVFHSTIDSTLNTTKNIKNFNQITSIENLDFENGASPDVRSNFKNNHFGSFINNHKMKLVWLDENSFNFPGDTTTRKINDYLPDLRNNFKELAYIRIGGTAGQFTNDLNFTLPKLKSLVFLGELTSAQIDTVINQVAAGTQMYNGGLVFAYNSAVRTSASDNGLAILAAKAWLVVGGGADTDNPFIGYPLYAIPDSAKVSDAFTDFINEKLHLNYNYKQVDSIYGANNVVLNLCPAHCDTCYNSLSGPLLCGKSQPVFPSVRIIPSTGCTDSTFFAVGKGTALYNYYTDSLRNRFDSSYLTKCLSAYKLESFTVTRPNSEYHYTLYYYDQAGNLVKTVPPAGVNESKFRWSNAWSDSVSLARRNGQMLVPVHALPTQYRYNTLNQVVAQQTPDAGKSSFWYDRLGLLVISQNARQRAVSSSELNRNYSYTQYDYLGRIAEVGEIKNATSDTMSSLISRVPASLQSWITASVAGKSQITATVYDLPYTGFTLTSPLLQRNLRNRVAYTSFTQGNNPAQYNQATFYSYDIHGNVDTLVQDYGNSSFTAVQNIMNANNNRFKKLVYRYDLISGKVNHVAYQPGKPDQFFHRYSYDAENRITDVETSTDSIFWQKDARYEYYKHGPLARTRLGDQLVQGLDYAYTLQGWLKGMNSTALTPDQDLSSDGLASGPNKYIARDAIGFNLNYYDEDYQPIGDNVDPFPAVNGTQLSNSYRPLYNGNISSMAVNIGKFGTPVLYNYKYDRLNRLTQMDTWKGFNANGNNWSGMAISEDYKERIAYDPNGNIMKYLRNTAGTTAAMDSMNYKYYAGTNRLSYIKDNASAAVATNDIENQPVDNYKYDEIGNLTGDLSENMSSGSITWNVYGKITAINRTATSGSNTTKQILYSYDAAGNRIGKKVIKFGSPTVEHTWYVRDASGNVMSVYTAKKDTTVGEPFSGFALTLTEQHLYGSSRLGIQRRSENVEGDLTMANVYKQVTGLRYYELSNHLGNVLATISDKKIGVASTTNSSLIDHYNADVVSAQDFYPFGMLMPGRSFSGSSYRYGFNGKENDNDVKGEGNQQDYGMRILDPRIGRFLSVDPMTQSYPWNSTYAYSEGDPINYIDIDGAEQGGRTAQATPRVTLPELGNTLSVGPNGRLVNNTQLFPEGAINSGIYGPQTKFVSQSELEAMIPPNAGAYINPDGKSMTVMGPNGSWMVPLLKVNTPKTAFTWVDRALWRVQSEIAKQFNFKQWNIKIQDYEVITTDPATLNNDYLDKVNRRLINGTATDQDKLYANEVERRKSEGTLNDPLKVTFIQGSGDNAKKVTVDVPAGYRKSNLKSHGQAVYTNGKNWITPDQDGHNGGKWKMYSSEKNVGGGKDKRVGTYDANLNKVGE